MNVFMTYFKIRILVLQIYVGAPSIAGKNNMRGKQTILYFKRVLIFRTKH